MYQVKSVGRRLAALIPAIGILAGVAYQGVAPALASADALNPLTHRALTLSSSSPGWSYTDGSGNATYAPPNSGANGKQTGNTFSYDVSSTQGINGLSFQYCTTAAGTCLGPGDDGYTNTSGTYTRNADSSSTSDLALVTASPAEISSGHWTTISGSASQIPPADNSQGNFVVLTSTNGGTTWTYNGGWSMASSNLEGDIVQNHVGATGKSNYITLLNSGTVSMTSGESMKVIFFGTNTNYITNPGAGAFFVKINDYEDTNASPAAGDLLPTDAQYATGAPAGAYIVDGGVTVANVMNQSIEIQTKVLETMDFSVGTVDPDTLSNAQLSTATGGTLTSPGQCDSILNGFTPTGPQNTLIIGNEAAENSLMTSDAFATHSYLRLSSNSAGGATIYYSGVTLSNTEGNQIDAAGITMAHSIVGTEQFGLGLDIDSSTNSGGTGTYAPDYSVATTDGASNIKFENGADTDNTVNTPAIGAPVSTAGSFGVSSNWTSYQSSSGGAAHNPQLAPLLPTANYGSAEGGINGGSHADTNTGAQFSFDPNANTVPVPIATENTAVVNCVTGKVRYLANIAATTAAGIYTTKVNYIAAPQY